VTASVQVLVKDKKYEGIQQTNRRQWFQKGSFRQGESTSKDQEVQIWKTLPRAKEVMETSFWPLAPSGNSYKTIIFILLTKKTSNTSVTTSPQFLLTV
jgi:hypothetical protein